MPGIVWALEGEQSETDVVPALLEPLVWERGQGTQCTGTQANATVASSEVTVKKGAVEGAHRDPLAKSTGSLEDASLDVKQEPALRGRERAYLCWHENKGLRHE